MFALAISFFDRFSGEMRIISPYYCYYSSPRMIFLSLTGMRFYYRKMVSQTEQQRIIFHDYSLFCKGHLTAISQ